MEYDVIGPWSEIKLDIVRNYASAYARILSAQESPGFHHIYIDAFAGRGIHRSRTSGGFVPGSPLNALRVHPPFREYHFIDLDGTKIKTLSRIAGTAQGRSVDVHHGDCNAILLHELLPRVKYEEYRRALCLLDPYGLHLDWAVIAEAARLRTVELFLNFPLLDMNRNVLWRNPGRVNSSQIHRMNRFWGDDSWRQIAYRRSEQMVLFGEPFEEKAASDDIAQAFRKRLKSIAGFGFVPDPVPMRNTRGNIIYYLFFAAHKAASAKIVTDIFNKYRSQ